MSIDDFVGISQIIQGIAVMISVVYAAYQLKLIRKTHSDNHDWNRRKAAQDLTVELVATLSETSDLHKALNVINRTEPIPVSEILDAINKDPSIQLKINKVLNLYSSLSRGVSSGIYDEDVIWISRGEAMLKTYNSFSSYIIYRRNESLPNVWRSFEQLANKWK